jgi:mono/diheme cytochrome c family protein
MKSLAYAIGVMLAALSVGCAPTPKSGAGFTLPDGDAEVGKAAYVQMHCNACHTISGVDQLVAADGEAPEVSVTLGGEVARIKTYGELVTAIINPSHKLARGYKQELVTVDGESKMTNYNDVMTVTELTDLVAYLQSNYKIRPYEPTYYPMYGP